MGKIRYELYGAGLLAVVAGLVALALAMYAQVFTPVVPVTMQIDRAGLQLLPGSDVKLRGIIVGTVDDITSDGTGATITMSLKPSMAHRIPANVSARLLPKTIFGEKYVDLVLPEDPSPRPLAAGSVIPQDRARSTLEIDQALDNLLPLLRTVKPAELNATLSALATALSGRGEQLGTTVVRLGDYLTALNPHLPQLQHDLAALSDVAGTYDEAAPALLRMLRNFTVTANTVVTNRAQLRAFLDDMTGTSDTLRELVARNAQDIVSVNAVSRPVLKLLERYSPEYPCFFKGYANLIPRIHAAMPNTPKIKNSAHVIIEFVPSYPTYQYPQDLPEFLDDRGPNCYGLPNPPMSLPNIQFKDGTEDDPRFNPSAKSAPAAGAQPTTYGDSPAMGLAGTAEDRLVLKGLAAPMLQISSTSVPDLAALLWGPLVRGSGVTLS